MGTVFHFQNKILQNVLMQIWDLIIFSHLSLAVVELQREQWVLVLQGLASEALPVLWSFCVDLAMARFPTPPRGLARGSGSKFEALCLAPH